MISLRVPDDVVLVTRTTQALKNALQKLKQEAEKYGLTINRNKTKYMRHSRTQINGKDMELEIEGMRIEEVCKSKYFVFFFFYFCVSVHRSVSQN